MEWQQEWHRIMQPVAGMYKFRLPWSAGETEYLDGEVFLPVWGPQTTTETRLIVTKPASARRLWNNRRYEEQMFYFNNVTRCCLYEHDVAAAGLDHCFDCSSEVRILRQYLNAHFRQHFPRSRLGELSETDVLRRVSSLVDQLTVQCGGRPGGRNLLNWHKRLGR
jgi:cap2 methyltransferase